MKKEFLFKYDHSELEMLLSVDAVSKTGAIKCVRLLVQEPHKWILVEIREIRGCHIPIRDSGGTES